jgi:hypothetical protein
LENQPEPEPVPNYGSLQYNEPNNTLGITHEFATIAHITSKIACTKETL